LAKKGGDWSVLIKFQILILQVRCSTGAVLRNNPMLRLIFDILPALTKTFSFSIQRGSIRPEMSNKIALVSLDFAGTGSMCVGKQRSRR
jgi:hypothetical protein